MQDLIAQIPDQRLHEVDHRRPARTVEQNDLGVHHTYAVVPQNSYVVGHQLAVLRGHRVVGEAGHALAHTAFEARNQQRRGDLAVGQDRHIVRVRRIEVGFESFEDLSHSATAAAHARWNASSTCWRSASPISNPGLTCRTDRSNPANMAHTP